MTLEVRMLDKYRNNERQVTTHDTEFPTLEGRLMMALVEKWGMVAAIDAGEDSAGRAKLALSTPEQVVERAARTARLTVETIRENDWFVQGPSLDELLKAETDEK